VIKGSYRVFILGCLQAAAGICRAESGTKLLHLKKAVLHVSIPSGSFSFDLMSRRDLVWEVTEF
jgi:hypothetical protein